MQMKHTLHAPLLVPNQFKIVVYHKIANFQWKCNFRETETSSEKSVSKYLVV